jgi:hypothetical protein
MKLPLLFLFLFNVINAFSQTLPNETFLEHGSTLVLVKNENVMISYYSYSDLDVRSYRYPKMYDSDTLLKQENGQFKGKKHTILKRYDTWYIQEKNKGKFILELINSPKEATEKINQVLFRKHLLQLENEINTLYPSSGFNSRKVESAINKMEWKTTNYMDFELIAIEEVQLIKDSIIDHYNQIIEFSTNISEAIIEKDFPAYQEKLFTLLADSMKYGYSICFIYNVNLLVEKDPAMFLKLVGDDYTHREKLLSSVDRTKELKKKLNAIEGKDQEEGYYFYKRYKRHTAVKISSASLFGYIFGQIGYLIMAKSN